MANPLRTVVDSNLSGCASRPRVLSDADLESPSVSPVHELQDRALRAMISGDREAIASDDKWPVVYRVLFACGVSAALWAAILAPILYLHAGH
jgi:hypothetical protein